MGRIHVVVGRLCADLRSSGKSEVVSGSSGVADVVAAASDVVIAVVVVVVVVVVEGVDDVDGDADIDDDADVDCDADVDDDADVDGNADVDDDADDVADVDSVVMDSLDDSVVAGSLGNIDVSSLDDDVIGSVQTSNAAISVGTWCVNVVSMICDRPALTAEVSPLLSAASKISSLLCYLCHLIESWLVPLRIKTVPKSNIQVHVHHLRGLI